MKNNIQFIPVLCILSCLIFVGVPTSRADNKKGANTEERTILQARELWQQRDYKAAREKLETIEELTILKPGDVTLSMVRTYLKQAHDVMAEGLSQLKEKVGDTYPVPLKGGGSLHGKIVDVNDDSIVLTMRDTQHQIALDRIDIERIIRLSALKYKPDLPKNQALFAVILAMEGEYEEAHKFLQQAKLSGYEVAAEKGFTEWSKRVDKASQQKDNTNGDTQVEDEDEEENASTGEVNPEISQTSRRNYSKKIL
ncbi:MAG: hypothetical protein ACOC0A_03195, partial [Planctomycetota bacterium]